MDGVKIAIILGVIIAIVVVVALRMSREHSGFESVITKFIEAGAARNIEAAYACWSPWSASAIGKEEIDEFIESRYDDLFTGYERLTINQRIEQSIDGIPRCSVSGDIIYSGDQRLPLGARLVKENNVWKIIGIRIGSTSLFFN